MSIDPDDERNESYADDEAWREECAGIGHDLPSPDERLAVEPFDWDAEQRMEEEARALEDERIAHEREIRRCVEEARREDCWRRYHPEEAAAADAQRRERRNADEARRLRDRELAKGR